LWGQPILLQGGLGPDIVSPIYKYGEEERPIDEWMYENYVTPALPAEQIMSTELTPEEYSRYVELAGNELKNPTTGLGAYDTLNAMIEGNHSASSQWGRATDGPEGGRALIVLSTINDFRTAAQAQLLEEFPELRDRILRRATERDTALDVTIMNPTAGDAP
jgi:hypothetical protein